MSRVLCWKVVLKSPEKLFIRTVYREDHSASNDWNMKPGQDAHISTYEFDLRILVSGGKADKNPGPMLLHIPRHILITELQGAAQSRPRIS